eukprot:Pgem_evm1s19291
MNLLGYAPLPFDRHDWVVESNGVHRKYVIDYYADEDDDSGIPNIYLDVRPCILSFSDEDDDSGMYTYFVLWRASLHLIFF